MCVTVPMLLHVRTICICSCPAVECLCLGGEHCPTYAAPLPSLYLVYDGTFIIIVIIKHICQCINYNIINLYIVAEQLYVYIYIEYIFLM